MTVHAALVAALILLVSALALTLSLQDVGRQAQAYGEDPRRWQMISLLAGVMGWFVVRLLLSRRRGGPGGGGVA